MTFLAKTSYPFFEARMNWTIATDPQMSPERDYARLPDIPMNSRRVPHLTSLYYFDCIGMYGDRRLTGNCGRLIKNLLTYFLPTSLLDPMAGNGTTRDVCKGLNTPCLAFNSHQGFEACDSYCFSSNLAVDSIWVHPPYWRHKLYLKNLRDPFRSPSLEDFLGRYGPFIQNCCRIMVPGGKLAIVMGDYGDFDCRTIPLTHCTKRLAFDAGLRRPGTDIIRLGHGASSSRKIYHKSFNSLLARHVHDL